jgi:hypothetical protein
LGGYLGQIWIEPLAASIDKAHILINLCITNFPGLSPPIPPNPKSVTPERSDRCPPIEEIEEISVTCCPHASGWTDWSGAETPILSAQE